MEKYKNARNKNPGPADAADSSGKLRRYEGFEKDLHKILNKTSAKSTTPAAARGGGISSDVMAPLQPVRYAVIHRAHKYQKHYCHTLYTVTLVVEYLGWVDLD